MSNPVPPGGRVTSKAPYLQKWPKYTYQKGKNEGRLTEEYKEWSVELNTCYDLVKVGSYIMGRKLKLIAGGPKKGGIVRAATDGTNIFLPKNHPNRLTVTKHELAHIYFGSNLALRLAFVRTLISEFTNRSGVSLPRHFSNSLTTDLCFLINILDDVRVNSLWGMLYPGDGRALDEWYFDIVGPSSAKKALERYPGGDVDHLFTYMNLLLLGQEVESSRWGRFRSRIQETADEVLWTSFSGCLMACRFLIEDILEELVQEDSEDPKQSDLNADPQQLQQARKEIGKEDEGDPDRRGQTSDVDADIKEKLEKAKIAKALRKMSSGMPAREAVDRPQGSFDIGNQVSEGEAACRSNTDEVKRLLDISKEGREKSQSVEQESASADLMEIKARLSARASSPPPTRDEWMKRSVLAHVDIVRVPRDQLRAAPISQADLLEANRWRTEFLRVMGLRRDVPSRVGSRINVQAMIQRRTTGRPLPPFFEERSARGFELLKSFDMSGSIQGVFPQIERLNVMLRKALDFPFVKQHEQGWTCKRPGVVTIYDYPTCSGNEGLVSSVSRVGGVTPLSHALEVGGQVLSTGRGEKHIHVFTDGSPVYLLKGGRTYMPESVLQEWTREAVLRLKQRRVYVWCWMIGPHTPGADSMDFMFGPGHWRKITEDQVYQDSLDFIRNQFIKYLKSR